MPLLCHLRLLCRVQGPCCCSPAATVQPRRRGPENVKLEGGEQIVIERSAKLRANAIAGGGGGSFNEGMTLLITKPIKPDNPGQWSAKYVPILLDRDPATQEWVIVATFFHCQSWEALGRPKLPYTEYRYRQGAWVQQTLSPQWIGREINVLPYDGAAARSISRFPTRKACFALDLLSHLSTSAWLRSGTRPADHQSCPAPLLIISSTRPSFMPTDIEYAQLANRVYARTQRNRTPTTGWKELSWLPDSVSGGGFSAGVYQNGNDIVIAYTGTNEGKALDFIAANIPAGGGLPSPQINEAMALYLETRRAHPNANIGFTGHSLGGGLASLMAVFFDRPAVTFDPAPFQASALNPLNLVLYRSWMLGAGMSDAAFSDYVVNFLSEFYRREGSVRSISLEGEILAVLRDQVPTIEGSHQVVPVGTPTLLQGGFAADGRVALHSMTMLAAMLASPALAQAIRAAPQLLEMIFDSRLYDRDPQVSLEPNFIDRLYVAHVTSNATPVLDRFAADIYLVTQAQGSAASDPMQRALMLAAMEYHYFRDPATASQLFDTAGGHLHFRWSDIAADASTLKSPRALANAVWSLDEANGSAARIGRAPSQRLACADRHRRHDLD